MTGMPMTRLPPMRLEELRALISCEDPVKNLPPPWLQLPQSSSSSHNNSSSATSTTQLDDHPVKKRPKANATNALVCFLKTESPPEVLVKLFAFLNHPLVDGTRMMASCRLLLHCHALWSSMGMAAFPEWNKCWRTRVRRRCQAVPYSEILREWDDGEAHGFDHIACHLVDAWTSLTHSGVLRTDWLHRRLLQYKVDRDYHDEEEPPRTKLSRRVLAFETKGFDALLNADNKHVLRRQEIAVVASDDQVAHAVEDWRELAFVLSLKRRLEALQLSIRIGDDGEKLVGWFVVQAPWLRGASAWSQRDFLQAILCPIDKDTSKHKEEGEDEDEEKEEEEDSDDEEAEEVEEEGEEEEFTEEGEWEVVPQHQREQESSVETLQAHWLEVMEKHNDRFFDSREDVVTDDAIGPANPSKAGRINGLSVKKLMDGYLYGTRVFCHRVATWGFGTEEMHFVCVGLSSTGHFVGFTVDGEYN